jgi:hypothetical protein
MTINNRLPVPTQAPPQSKSGRRDLNPRSRAPDDHRCAAVPGGIPGFPTSCSKSAQRELNPHFRHGKAVGCRYIMGANVVCRIVKERNSQEHREGLEPSSLQYGCSILAAGRLVLVLFSGAEGT